MNVAVPLDNGGYFFARPDTVGTSDGEIMSCEAGRTAPARVTQIVQCTLAALDNLKMCVPEGRC